MPLRCGQRFQQLSRRGCARLTADALVPISSLVNDASVAQIETDAIEYWHVELDQHDVVLAEGPPVKSYLDCGNRAIFDNGAALIEAFPDFQPKREDETCLPIVKHGPLVDRAKARLIERLLAAGFTIDREADIHVRADDERIEPIRLGQDRPGFVLPAELTSITLCSHTFTPCYVQVGSGDPRKLGVCVSRLEVDGEGIALADGAFGEGWHDCEYEGERPARRWTNGAAQLPSRARLVIVDIAGVGHYLRAPRQAEILPFTRRSS